MDELLSILFSMPTLPWTCLVIASVVYWLTVILGALDIDALGGADGGHGDLGDLGHGHLGHGDVGHGDVGHGDVGHGDAGHGDVGRAHGDGGDGGADHGHADGADAHGSTQGVLAILLSTLKLRSVPVTITLSFLGLYGWIVSYMLAKNLTLPLPEIANHTIVLATSFVLGLLATSASIRPLAPLFASKQGTKHRDLVGKVVRITTGRVDGKFGEGHLDDGGAGLQLQVRCADPDALARDDEALILGWDAKTESFEVEPMSSIAGKPQKRGRSGGPSRKST